MFLPFQKDKLADFCRRHPGICLSDDRRVASLKTKYSDAIEEGLRSARSELRDIMKQKRELDTQIQFNDIEATSLDRFFRNTVNANTVHVKENDDKKRIEASKIAKDVVKMAMRIYGKKALVNAFQDNSWQNQIKSTTQKDSYKRKAGIRDSLLDIVDLILSKTSDEETITQI